MTKHKIILNLFFLSLLAICFTACNDPKNGKAVPERNKNVPSEIIYNFKSQQRDSGQVKYNMQAPLLEKYGFLDTTYVELKRGIYLEFFDYKKSKKPGQLWADYAKIIEKTEFYLAKGNVKVINLDGKIFLMESIYWDKRNKKMHTKDPVTITDIDGSVFKAANGMEAQDDFSAYTFFNNTADFNVKKMPH